MADGDRRGRSPLPMTLEELDAHWLTAALSARFPGVEVEDVGHDEVTHGTATRARLVPTYRPGRRGPSSLWLKAGFEEHAAYLMTTGTYANEVHFYRELRDRIAIPSPTCWYGELDTERAQFVLLLEDLVAAGARFGRATAPLAPAQVGSVLALLARVHARWWEHPELDGLGWLGSLAHGDLADHYRRREPDVVRLALARPRASRVPRRLQEPEQLARAFRGMLDVGTTAPSCLLHGDAHLGNVYFHADGTPGLLDWQGVKRGRWAYDVAQILAGALTVEARRRHEGGLLDGYLAELTRLGAPAPDHEDAWFDYRRHLVSPLVGWLCTSGYQPEDVCAANVERFATAVDDLDALALWDQPPARSHASTRRTAL